MPFLKDKRKLLSNSVRLNQSAHKNGNRRSIYTIYNDKYIGNWKDSKKEGHGSYLNRTFRLYEGEWKNDLRHGFGVLNRREANNVFNLEYRGDWKNGYQNGFGERHYKDGGYYLGEIKNSRRQGYGRMWYRDGSYYDGYWMKNLRDGLGMLVRADGNRYEGAWMNNLKHGKGRFFHLDSGQMQEGVWEENICVSSVLGDIPFRQTAVSPTEYPLPVIAKSR